MRSGQGSHKFQGLKAIHFVGSNRSHSQGPGEAGWSPARWAVRTGSAREFDMDRSTGRVTVPEAGIYYLYGQVKNDDPNPDMP